MSINKNIFTFLFGFIVFCVSVIYIVARFDWFSIYDLLLSVNYMSLLLGASISIVIFWIVRSVRWFVILKVLGVNSVSMKASYLASSYSLGLSIITPFQAGEILKVEILKRMVSVPRTSGYISYAIEKFIDLAVVLVMACIGLLVSSDLPLNYDLIFLVISIFIMAIAIAWWLIKVFSQKYDSAEKIYHSIQFIFSKPVIFSQLIFLTVISWLSIAAGWWWTLYHIEIVLGFFEALALTCGMTLINVFSLIPGGIGISEAGISYSLINMNIQPVLANTGSILLRVYALIAVIMALLHLPFLGFFRQRIFK